LHFYLHWRPNNADMDARISGLFNPCPLFRKYPDLFEAFVATYREIVELAIQQTISGTDRNVFPKLRTLAREAGQRDALPQDLIAVHLSALSVIVKTKPQAMVRACIRHSRLLLVKMVGELAIYYRERSIGPKAG
jgi:hypothetical protein